MYQSLWFFVIYAMLGWCLEVVFCSINTGKFVNRGFLNGPVCPIYGFGAVIIILALTPISHNIFLLYAGTVLLTSLLELVTGWALRKLFKTSWWDYSDQPFNIGGYICLKFSLAWGVAGVFLMKIIHPAISGLVHLIPVWAGWVALAFLYSLLLADLIVTVSAILKLNRDLGEITVLTKGLHSGSEKLAENIGNTAIAISEKIDNLDLKDKKLQLEERVEESKKRISTSLEESKQKFNTSFQEQQKKRSSAIDKKEALSRKNKLLTNRFTVRERLLKAFPNMNNHRFQDALNEMRAERTKSKNSTNHDEPSGS